MIASFAPIPCSPVSVAIFATDCASLPSRTAHLADQDIEVTAERAGPALAGMLVNEKRNIAATGRKYSLQRLNKHLSLQCANNISVTDLSPILT